MAALDRYQWRPAIVRLQYNGELYVDDEAGREGEGYVFGIYDQKLGAHIAYAEDMDAAEKIVAALNKHS